MNGFIFWKETHWKSYSFCVCDGKMIDSSIHYGVKLIYSRNESGTTKYRENKQEQNVTHLESIEKARKKIRLRFEHAFLYTHHHHNQRRNHDYDDNEEQENGEEKKDFILKMLNIYTDWMTVYKTMDETTGWNKKFQDNLFSEFKWNRKMTLLHSKCRFVDDQLNTMIGNLSKTFVTIEFISKTQIQTHMAKLEWSKKKEL